MKTPSSVKAPKSMKPTKAIPPRGYVDNSKSTVYLSNLSYRRDRADIKRLMSEFGEVKYVKLVMDQETQTSKGMAFVEMSNAAEAQAAIQALKGQIIDGRTMKAAPAIPMGGPVTVRLDATEKMPEEKKPRTRERRVGNLSSLQDYLAKKSKKAEKTERFPGKF